MSWPDESFWKLALLYSRVGLAEFRTQLRTIPDADEVTDCQPKREAGDHHPQKGTWALGVRRYQGITLESSPVRHSLVREYYDQRC